jgi:mono/diheme cytochrome c family protein
MMDRKWIYGLPAIAAALCLNLVVFPLTLPRPAVAKDLVPSPASASATAGRADPLIERGRYVAILGGCHDCHTDGYAEADGKVPADRWLTGKEVGFRGPWGVSYPTNLRLSVQRMSEEQWVVYARAPRLPPMPWFNLRDMEEQDLRALYRFLRDIGPSGKPAPAPVGPEARVTTPYIEFVPQNLPVAAAR